MRKDNEHINIDDLLREIEHEQKNNTQASNTLIDDDVNEILKSLGISAEPSADKTQEGNAHITRPSKQSIQSRPADQPQEQQGVGASDGLSDEKVTTYIKSNAVPAKIITAAPLSAPVVQRETQTIELPTIKAYSEMQAKRAAQIERNAIEMALAISARRMANEAKTDGKSTKTPSLNFKADGLFHEFFSKTVANTKEMADEGEVPAALKEKQKQRRQKGKAKEEALPTIQEQSVDENKNDELAQISFDDISEAPVQESAPIHTETAKKEPELDITGIFAGFESIDLARPEKSKGAESEADSLVSSIIFSEQSDKITSIYNERQSPKLSWDEKRVKRRRRRSGGLEVHTEPIGMHDTLTGFNVLSQTEESFGKPVEQQQTTRAQESMPQKTQNKNSTAAKAPKKPGAGGMYAEQADRRKQGEGVVAQSNESVIAGLQGLGYAVQKGGKQAAALSGAGVPKVNITAQNSAQQQQKTQSNAQSTAQASGVQNGSGAQSTAQPSGAQNTAQKKTEQSPNVASDTFMQNHVDTNAQIVYEKASQLDSAQPGANASRPNAAPKMAKEDLKMFAPDGFDGKREESEQEFWAKHGVENINFNTSTDNFPVTYSSTLGIDPDKYGVPDEDYTEKDDYNTAADAPYITKELKRRRMSALVQSIICAVAFVFLILIRQFVGIGQQGTAAVSISESIFLLLNLITLVLLCVVCIKSVKTGLIGIFGRPSVNTLITLSLLGAIVQTAIYMAMPQTFSIGTVTIFAPVSALILFASRFGKWLYVKTVAKNFDLVGTGEEHYAAFIMKGKDLTKRVCSGLDEADPLLLVSRPTALMRGFMKHSFSSHMSDVSGRKLGIILFMSAVMCGVLTTVIYGFSADVFSVAAGVLCLGCPLASTLIYAVPEKLLHTAASKVRAVVPGARSVQSLGLCNTVMLRADELFPQDNVTFEGLRMLRGKRLDLAVLYAASVVNAHSKTMRNTFLQLVNNKTNVLYPVATSEYITDLGISAIVDNKHIVFGNRAMMRRYSVEIPSLEFEKSYLPSAAHSVAYLAINGQAFSIFILSYKPSKSARQQIQSLVDQGFNLIVKSDDFNITSQKVAYLYNVSGTTVKVLTQAEQDMIEQQTQYTPESEGYMIHSANSKSFTGGIVAAAMAARREKLSNSIQLASMLFTMLLFIILSVAGVLQALSLPVIIVCQLAWCAITLLPALLKE